MTLGEMTSLIASKLLLNQEENSLEAIRRFIRLRHTLIWDSFLWKDAVATYYGLPVPKDPVTGEYLPDMVMPDSVSRVIAIYDERHQNVLNIGTLIELARSSSLDGVGGLRAFMDVSATGIPIPTTSLQLNVRFLADPLDIAQSATLAVGGDFDSVSWSQQPSGGELPSSTIVVPFTSGGWHRAGRKIARITKPVTKAPVFVSVQDIDAMTPEVSWSWAAESTICQYARVRWIQKPSLTRDGPDLRVTVIAKRKPRPMLNDGDSPALRGCEQALVAMATGDALERERMYQKAASKFAEGISLQEVMKDNERNQSAYVARLVPEEPMHAGGREDLGY